MSVQYLHNVSVSFFFFKQKTAYEMRISYWSSDVCSSDLADRMNLRGFIAREQRGAVRLAPFKERCVVDEAVFDDFGIARPQFARRQGSKRARIDEQIGRASCRDRVGPYVSLAVGGVALTKKTH